MQKPARGWTWRLGLAWGLQIMLAAVFAFTAWRKFIAHPVPVETVEALGAGQWLRVAIGIAELAGAIGLLVPRLAWLAAGCLALLMLGATGTHLFLIGGSPAFAIVLMLGCATVAWLRLGIRP
jgi:uncharacterized membrane protein YphA (DoxX/SURF4 family)